MTMSDDLRAAGRRAHQGRSWRQAAEALRAADSTGCLGPEDLSMLAEAAFLSGDGTGWVQAHERAFAAHTARGAARPAARSALWIGQILALRGAQTAAGGWLGRAARMLDGCGVADCAERGYLLMPAARAHYAAGRYAEALEVARVAEETGRPHEEDDLVAFAQHSRGRALLRLERLDEGIAVLDQVFVEVFPGGLAAGMLTGLVACSVVTGGQEVGAFDRAAEWTAALSAWCDEQPELVQFSAECLVHRAEVLLRRGHWSGSLAEAQAAARCAERDGVAAMAAAAAYGQGEALRLLGRVDEAERAYQDARRGGHDPMPGLARLHVAQGRGPAALAGLQRVLAMTDDPLRRAHLLTAAVEVHLAAGSAAAADELTGQALADRLPRPLPDPGRAGAARPHAARLGAPGPGAVVRTRTAVALVTLALAVPAFALTPRLFPPSPHMTPTAAQVPFYVALGGINALALGLGVAFLDTGPLLWIEYGFHVLLIVAPLVLIWAVAGFTDHRVVAEGTPQA